VTVTAVWDRVPVFATNAWIPYQQRGLTFLMFSAGFLPTVGHSFAVAFALHFNSVETFGILPPSQFPFSYRGLARQKFSPMLSVPMYSKSLRDVCC